MNKEKYLTATIKKIQCSKKRKSEIKRELSADIQTALESGEKWEQIKERLESPENLAKEFNENLSEAEHKKFGRMRIFKVIGLLVSLIVLIAVGRFTMQPKTYPIEYQERFSEQTVVNQAECMIELLNKEDYDTIKNNYSDATMAKAFEGNSIKDTKKQIGAKWNLFKSYTSIYTAQLRQGGKTYAVVQITALYEDKSVEYTISFDQNMKLAGLFMK